VSGGLEETKSKPGKGKKKMWLQCGGRGGCVWPKKREMGKCMGAAGDDGGGAANSPRRLEEKKWKVTLLFRVQGRRRKSQRAGDRGSLPTVVGKQKNRPSPVESPFCRA